MSDSKATGPPDRHAGRLEGAEVPDLLWALCREGRTGILGVCREGIRKSIYLDEGRPIFAASTDPDDRLGERLLRAGRITVDRLEQAISQLPSSERIGELLVEAGSMTRDDLVDGVLAQLESIVLDLFRWEAGDFDFAEGPLPSEEDITLTARPAELLLRGVRAVRSFDRVRANVGPPRTVFGLTEGWQVALEGVRLENSEELLVERMRNSDETVEELCREVFLSNFEIYQTIWGLKVIGVVAPRPARTESEQAMHQGALARQSFPEVLVRLASSNETGVLYVTQGPRERSFHISEGRCSFATSNSKDDGLVAFLLRRGVISLRDREETAKRVLSNKRVGTILRELGVIDDQDLEEMVRRHLLEIVYDTFRWEEGEFAFIAGPLPTHEDITIEVSLESLIGDGLSGVESWRRAQHGCGGLDGGLELTPDYLDVLDRMGAGAEEWQVIAALRTSRTPREICRAAELPDYRVCQILWSMRVLGAVQSCSLKLVADVDRQAGTDASAGPGPAAGAGEDAPHRVEIEELDGATELAELAEAPEVADGPAGDRTQALSADEVREALGRATDPEEAAGAAADQTQVISQDAVRAALAPGDADSSAEDSEERDEPRDAEPPLPSTTQMISADTVRAALEGDRGKDPEPPSPQSTQVISADTVRAALDSAHPAYDDQEEGDGDDAIGNDAPDNDAPAEEPTEVPADAAADGPEKAVTTQGIPRTEVDAALSGEDDDEHRDVDGLGPVIATFNAMHRVVYQVVRAEVGAGAANFIRACCGPLNTCGTALLDNVDMRLDGSWEVRGLEDAIVESGGEDPTAALREFIDREVDFLRVHIGDARITELRRRIDRIERDGGRA